MSIGRLILWVLLLGSGPVFVCVWLGFWSGLPLSLTKRKAGWGICGSSFVVFVDLFFVLSACYCGPTVSLYKHLFTAYAHVRTEPQSDIGQTRGKRKLKLGEIDDSLFANMWVTRVASSSNPADFPSRGSLHLCPYGKVERGRTAMQLLSQSVEMQCKMPTNANNMRKM